jgi:hypothetical protein
MIPSQKGHFLIPDLIGPEYGGNMERILGWKVVGTERTGELRSIED